MSGPVYEVIGGEEDYVVLPTGFEEMDDQRNEFFRNGGKFTSSEFNLPNNARPMEKSVVVEEKTRSRTLPFRFWSCINVKPTKPKDNSKNSPPNKFDLNNKSGTCHLPCNNGDNYEEINFDSPARHTPMDKLIFRPLMPDPKLLNDTPMEVPNKEPSPFLQEPPEPMNSKVIKVNKKPLKPDPKLLNDTHTPMEVPYKEPSPFFQEPPEPVDSKVIKVNNKPFKPDVPMRRTISHRAVHSHKHPILEPQFQDMTAKPPKRAQSLRVKEARLSQPVQPKKEIMDKPKSEEKYPTDTKTTPSNDIPNNKNTPPNIHPRTLNRVRNPAQNHVKDGPPDISAKPIRPKRETETPKEINIEKNTFGERKERKIQDLESHLKKFNIINAIDCNSQFRMQNEYQKSPTKEVCGLKQITS